MELAKSTTPYRGRGEIVAFALGARYIRGIGEVLEFLSRTGVTRVTGVTYKIKLLNFKEFIGVTHFSSDRYTVSKMENTCNTSGILGFSVE